MLLRIAKRGQGNLPALRVSTKSTPCHRKPAKAGFRWFHQFFVKWRFRAKLPGNAHFTAKN
jgi:hypothetical protein